MTREEGIIKRWTSRPPGARKGNTDQLIDFEYNNYTELCYFCYEKPLPKKDWLSQQIKIDNKTK